MIIVMKKDATQNQIETVINRLESIDCEAHVSVGRFRTVIGAVGDRNQILQLPLEALAGVERAVPVMRPYKLVSREFQESDTVVEMRGVCIGDGSFTSVAGPCAVESRDVLFETAEAVRAAGATVLRGDAFKPRTSPYSFRGMGIEGLKLLRLAQQETGLPIITEVMATEDVDTVAEYADILQIGARNMQNYSLLDAVGAIRTPVMVKRGLAASYEDWLLAAEYVMAGGNEQVMLCERGVRAFEQYTRFTMDVAAIPVIQRLSHLPIIADPSHSTGRWYLVTPVALAAVAAGAHGLLVEVHPNPDVAKCDGPQSLTFQNFDGLMTQVKAVASVRKQSAQPVAVS